MSFELINLNKLLRICALHDDKARSALKREAYQDRRREEHPSESGGDFYGPFWSDAKSYATEGTDLELATSMRIERHGVRDRLYSVVCPQFIEWWQRFEGSMNEEMAPLDENVHARREMDGLGITVKVDNLLCFRIDPDRHRLIYPYFSEEPSLSSRWARVGIWVMSQVLEGFRVQDMVILDVHRARSFSVREIDLRGDEADIFAARIVELREVWEEILEEAS